MNPVTAEMLAGAVILGGAILVPAIVLVRLLMHRAAGPAARGPARQTHDAARVKEFSLARYHVMARLTSNEDFQFLAAQPGYRKPTGARLRRERRRIFRMYLRSLTLDFRALHAAARELVADAPEEHAELVGVLLRCQVVFWWRITLVELRLLMPAALPQLDIGPLIQPMEAIRLRTAEV